MTNLEAKRKHAALSIKANEKRLHNTIGLFEVACQTANTDDIINKREELHNILDNYLDFIHEVYFIDLQDYWRSNNE